jgi:hypothetical protein
MNRLRYPPEGDPQKGPVKLRPVDPASGWTADNTTWKSGLTAIAPTRDFKGGLAKSSWLLDEDVAFIYRADATSDRATRCWSWYGRIDVGTAPSCGFPAATA